MRYYKLLIIFFLSLVIQSVFPLNLFAEENSTVREDRVWNYDMYYMDINYLKKYEMNWYHFEGSQIIGDKEYSIFRDGNGKEVAKLRQEGQKVFLYTAEAESIYSSYPLDESVSVNEEGTISAEELLLYDFSAEKGDKFYSLNFDDTDICSWAEVTELLVTDVFEVESYGHSYRCLEVVETALDIYTYRIFEGIGSDIGILPFPKFRWLTAGSRQSMAFVNSVLDPDNEIIFQNPFGNWFPEDNMTVREDRVWNYKEFSLSPDIYNIEDLNGYHFEGTKIIGEKVYFIFRDGEGKELACLRQEGSKVFLYTADSPAFISPNSSVPDDKEGRETADEHLLYDFSLEPGDTFTSLCFFSRFDGSYAEPREYRVVDVYELESHGNKYRCLEITDADHTEDYLPYKIIEGIGSEKGILPFPQYDYVTSSQRYQLPIINTVVNEYGDEIYSNPDCNPYPGEAVEGIGISLLNLGYDGRRVTAQGEGDVEMTVMSLEGVTVFARAGNGTAAADVAALMQGVYVAEARCGSAVKRIKFIVK